LTPVAPDYGKKVSVEWVSRAMKWLPVEPHFGHRRRRRAMRRRLFVGTETLPSLDIRNLGVRYATNSGTVEALSNINLAMTEGDFVVAIGASGCGKTTLLSCIAGFLPPTHGTIELDGKPVTGPGADRGVVFQKHALMPWLDVGQNVEFGLRMRGVAAAERRTAAMEQLHLVGLDD